MVEKLQKIFKYFLSKLKNSHPQIHPSSPSSSSSPLKRILSGCKHPKTPSFSMARGNDRNNDITDNNDAATLEDVDQFLFENFKSLFLGDDEYEYTTDHTNNNNNNTTKATDDEDSESNHVDMKTRVADHHVNPMMMSPDLLNDVRTSGSGESIVLLSWSENMYDDFRKSMKQMVEARLRNHGRVDWGFMEELLMCYLNLNEKKFHKYVLSAYVDLLNGFRDGSSSEKSSPAMAETAVPVKRPMSVRTFGRGKVGI